MLHLKKCHQIVVQEILFWPSLRQIKNQRLRKVWKSRGGSNNKSVSEGTGNSISKCLFCNLQLFQKMNKNIRPNYYSTSSRMVSVRFFLKNWRHQKGISKLTDLYFDTQKIPWGNLSSSPCLENESWKLMA